jgi:hypothetical protein
VINKLFNKVLLLTKILKIKIYTIQDQKWIKIKISIAIFKAKSFFSLKTLSKIKLNWHKINKIIIKKKLWIVWMPTLMKIKI